MAYFIDETKKIAVKAEGKTFWGWNRKTGRFDLPIVESTPKCRMKRCSDFDARLYLFKQALEGYFERIGALSNRITERSEDNADISTITIAEAEDQLNAIEAFKNEVKPEIEILQTALREYGLEMSAAGQCLANSVKVLEFDIKIAMNSVEIARLKENSQKCTNGHCEECSYYLDCKQKEERGSKE